MPWNIITKCSFPRVACEDGVAFYGRACERQDSWDPFKIRKNNHAGDTVVYLFIFFFFVFSHAQVSSIVLSSRLPRTRLAKKIRRLLRYLTGVTINQKGTRIVVDPMETIDMGCTWWTKGFEENDSTGTGQNLVQRKAERSYHRTCVSVWLSVSISSTSAPSGFPIDENDGNNCLQFSISRR